MHMSNMPLHEHCRSCISRYCQVAVVEDMSCSMVFCENDCGNKFHLCKQYDHNERCLLKVIDCINKQYGCPKKFTRGKLGKHLGVCPANVLICTMEWNRWHHGCLISNFDFKRKVEKMAKKRVVDEDLDIACSIHDQSILLESVMPSSTLRYYSDLVDDRASIVPGADLVQKNTTEVGGETSFTAPSSQNVTRAHSVQKWSMMVKNGEDEILSMTRSLLFYVNCLQTTEVGKSRNVPVKDTKDQQKSSAGSFSWNNSKALTSSVKSREAELSSAITNSFGEIDECVQDFQSIAPGFMSLLDALDSDACIVTDVVNNLVDQVIAMLDSGPLEGPKLLTVDRKEGESVVQDHSEGTSNSRNERKKRTDKRKKRSWLYKTDINPGGYLSESWSWMLRKQVKDASTDTSDLLIDKSGIEWLSPEAFIPQEDIIFRLFSVLGASREGSPFKEKQISHSIMESSSQTVAPFLLHMNTDCIGRALRSSLSSPARNSGERRNRASSTINTEEGLVDCSEAPVIIPNKLKYNNLALGNVLESVPRYQTKPSSMYSFMCGCVMRRDQFSSHFQNIHCEIMSGLNGWIEQKCPYAAYGCAYSEPRFCPDHCSNRVVYDQDEGVFTVSPGHLKSRDDSGEESSHRRLSFVELPYEVHERILSFLDGYAFRQVSLTCTYFREFCKNHLLARGIVETKWIKRFYDDGTTSWKMSERVWSFPPTTAKINRWVLSDHPPIANHVSKYSLPLNFANPNDVTSSFRCPVVAECDIAYKKERIRVLPTFEVAKLIK